MNAYGAGRPWIGQATVRVEDERLVTGAGRFVDDHQPSQCLHAAFLRSPHARARIVAIDTKDAIAAPGVALVATGDHVVAIPGPAVNAVVPGLVVPRCPILANAEICAVGEPIAVVVAETLDEARDAVELIAVEFEELSAVVGPDDAVGAAPALPGTTGNVAFHKQWQTGDIHQAFGNAAAVAEVRVAQPRVCAMSLEARSILANWNAGEQRLDVWLSTQTPHRARSEFARMLGLREDRVRVRAHDVGGAFGVKASLYPEEIATAWLSCRLTRPVKWIATRSEEMISATHGRGGRMEGELALAADGTMLALRAHVTMPLGRWLTYSAAIPAWNAGRILPGPYRVTTLDVAVQGITENAAAVGIYRGAGRPEAAMLLERLVDDGARRLGIDPVDLRRRNVLRADALPHCSATGQVLDSGNFAELLDRACDGIGYVALRRLQAARRREGQLLGIGVALYVEPCGNGWETARVVVDRAGRAIVGTGAAAQGQGRETTFAQIASDALGVDMAMVDVIAGDSSATSTGVGALASRSTAIGGSAVLRAAADVIRLAKPIAARLLNCSGDEVNVAAGGLAPLGEPARVAPWSAIADAAGGMISAEATFNVSGETWASGCCIAMVCIDRDTGSLSIEKLVWADDAGVVVNPRLAEGQLIGGMAQGIGQALLERHVYDETGQLLTGSLMDYAVPRATDVPDVTILSQPTPAKTNPLGAKGVGEAGCIGIPAAIANAAVDALAPLGVRHLDVPLNSEALWWAIQDATAGTGAAQQ